MKSDSDEICNVLEICWFFVVYDFPGLGKQSLGGLVKEFAGFWQEIKVFLNEGLWDF